MRGHWSLEITERDEANLKTAVDIQYKPHDIDLFFILA